VKIKDHWALVKLNLKYLRRKKDTFLIYRGDNEPIVKGYTDASFYQVSNDFKS
jgi:hypothetical protein